MLILVRINKNLIISIIMWHFLKVSRYSSPIIHIKKNNIIYFSK